ncbi:MAG: lysylphosphatidylglycerol synthase transmembrane domain-containing protein [bacterium]
MNKQQNESKPDNHNRSIINFIKRIAVVILVFLVFYYLLNNIISNWIQVKNFSWRPNFLFLSAATLLEIFIQFGGVFIWKKLINSLGGEITYRRCLKIWFTSALGRYLPGKAWQMVGMIWLLSKQGISSEISVTASIFVQLYSLIPGLVVGMFSIIFLIPIFNITWTVLILIILIIFTISFAHPKVIGKITEYLAKKRGKQITLSGISLFSSFIYILTYFGYWIIRGLAFFFFIRAWLAVPSDIIFLLISIFTASYVSGLLFLLAPGGIGVREGIMQKLLEEVFKNSGKIAAGITSAVSILNRIWLTLIEMICLLISIALNWGIDEKRKT